MGNFDCQVRITPSHTNWQEILFVSRCVNLGYVEVCRPRGRCTCPSDGLQSPVEYTTSGGHDVRPANPHSFNWRWLLGAAAEDKHREVRSHMNEGSTKKTYNSRYRI